jgi:hypothetical protein
MSVPTHEIHELHELLGGHELEGELEHEGAGHLEGEMENMQAVNELIEALRRNLLKMAAAVSSAERAAVSEPSGECTGTLLWYVYAWADSAHKGADKSF